MGIVGRQTWNVKGRPPMQPTTRSRSPPSGRTSAKPSREQPELQHASPRYGARSMPDDETRSQTRSTSSSPPTRTRMWSRAKDDGVATHREVAGRGTGGGWRFPRQRQPHAVRAELRATPLAQPLSATEAGRDAVAITSARNNGSGERTLALGSGRCLRCFDP